MRSLALILVLVLVAFFVASTTAGSCVVTNCNCKNIGPGQCGTCTGKNCYCDCPANVADDVEAPAKINFFNATIGGSLPTTCIMNNCNCKTWGDCSTCSGKNCQCSCQAVAEALQTESNGCLTNSQCNGAGCSSTVGSTTYCCPAGSSMCSISVVNGVGMCSCA